MWTHTLVCVTKKNGITIQVKNVLTLREKPNLIFLKLLSKRPMILQRQSHQEFLRDSKQTYSAYVFCRDKSITSFASKNGSTLYWHLHDWKGVILHCLLNLNELSTSLFLDSLRQSWTQGRSYLCSIQKTHFRSVYIIKLLQGRYYQNVCLGDSIPVPTKCNGTQSIQVKKNQY